MRPSALGDVARTVPVLASLRAAYPTARIDWLVRDVFAPIIAPHPALSNAVLFPRKDLARWARTGKWSNIRGFLRTLRTPKYDVVIDCQGLARSAWLARATGAPLRVGFADARELGWLPLTHRVRVPPRTHTVDKMLALVESLGVPALRDARATRLYSAQSDRDWLAQQVFAREGLYVVLAPTSAWPAKQWPAERFAQLTQRVLDSSPTLRVVIVGSAHETPQVAPLLALASREPRVFNLMGATTVGQLAATIERAACVVANDSAALHIAVGFDRPLVGLLGPTDPVLACPYGRLADVVQHVEPGDEFYFRDNRSAGMMTRISVEEVWARVATRLSAPQIAPTHF